MRSPLRYPSAHAVSGFAPGIGAWSLLFLGLLLAGCGQPVREDCSINWSRDGKAVGFQHGSEGVFVAGQEGGPPTKVFQPGPEVLAVSTPLWSPTGRQAIFTTARAADGPPNGTLALGSGGSNPAGTIHPQQPIVYTCWLYEGSAGGPPAQPTPLFEAACNHVGYVAANLAVRWSPEGKRLLFVREIGSGEHGLFDYDLKTRRSEQVFPHTALALLFDWTPDGRDLVCVLGGPGARQQTDGIWIGRPGEGSWWHVPHSGDLAPAALPSALEQLRATRPAWTRDGSRFAFVSWAAGKGPADPGRYLLHQGDRATHDVRRLAEGPEPLRDLHWADGRRLGVVQGGEAGSLHIVEPGRGLSPPLNRRPVRQFAGWDATGNWLAYIVPSPVPQAEGSLWAALLVANEHARDAVLVANGQGHEPGHEVFSGLRVTFPQWSPRETKLSLWVTFSPTYRSWVSLLLGWGLRPGDPAAIFDVKTAQLGWMAVNPQEKLQVGHYYLLKRNYAQAQRWYAEAQSQLPPARPPTVEQFLGLLRGRAGVLGSSFFQGYCLTKLGRQTEARAKLDEFQRTFLPEFRGPAAAAPVPGQTATDPFEAWLRQVLDPGEVFAALVRDLFAAEVFLSLDATDDAEAFFGQAVKAARPEPARLSSALVLGQILLLEQKYAAYADLMTGTAAPLLFRARPARPATGAAGFPDTEVLLDRTADLALLPLCSPEFLAGLPEAQVRALVQPWQAFRARAASDSQRYTADLVLRAVYQRLGRAREQQEAAERLRNAPGQGRVLAADADPRQTIQTLRQQILAFFADR